MVTARKYVQYSLGQASGENSVDWANDTIKVALLAATHTPDYANHEHFDDVSANEVAASGNYVAGGETLGTKTVNVSGDLILLGGADVDWDPSTIDAGFAVVYQDTENAETSRLIGLVDFEGEQSSSDGRFAVEWDAGVVIEHDSDTSV